MKIKKTTATINSTPDSYSVVCYDSSLTVQKEIDESNFTKAKTIASGEKKWGKWSRVIIRRNKGAAIGKPVMWKRTMEGKWEPFKWKGAVEYVDRQDKCEHPRLFK